MSDEYFGLLKRSRRLEFIGGVEDKWYADYSHSPVFSIIFKK
jgi:hypothetical protein